MPPANNISATPTSNQQATGTAAANGNAPQANGHAVADQSLRRAHFIVPHLTTTYLISSAAPPSTPGLADAIRDIEDREAERRMRDSGSEGLNWSLERIEEFYRECCRLRDETVLVTVVRSIQVRVSGLMVYSARELSNTHD